MEILFSLVFVAVFILAWISIWKLVAHRDTDLELAHDVVSEQVLHHEENKDRIMILFNAMDHVTNDDVEALLSVSNTTAWRYLEELESEGEIEQVGATGRSVYYRRAE